MKKQASKGKGLLDDGEEEMQLTINEDFAKQYERKKKSEEITQAKETIKRLEEELSSDESDDEEEDEVGLLDPLAEDQFLRILPLLAKKDPKLYEKDITFFPPAPAADAPGNGPAKPQPDPKAKQPFLLKNYVKGAVLKPTDEDLRARKREGGGTKEKPVLLKDFIRETLLKEGSEGLLESDEEDEGFKKPAPKELSHAEEQEMLKKQFLEAGEKLVADDGDEGDDDTDEAGFLKLRSKSKAEREQEEKEDEEFWKAEEKRTGKKQGSGDDVLSSFWLGGDLDENEKFLRSYILNNGWIDKEEGKIPTYEQILQEDEEDEEAIEQQEEFEMKHQEAVAFHYLEEGSDQIISHPRVIEDSARRKDSKRAKKREKRKEKKALERVQKEEELKRIKNLMKESIKKQLSKIQETSGASDLGFAEDYLEDEFDPTEHDRKMASTFDDDYYEGEGDEEMPVFNEDPDESEKNFGLQNTVGSLIGNKRADEEVYDEEEYYGGGGEEEAGQAQPDAAAESKRKMDELLEKYYALDFEDLIAGEIPCRFKYRQVKPKSYGMDVDTILTLPDAELNKRVSLKKLAPYRHFNLNAKKRAKRREKQYGGGDGGGGGHSRAANRWSSSSSSSSSKREWNGDGEQQQRQQSGKKRKFEEKSAESGDKKEKKQKEKKQKKEGGSKVEKSAEDKKEKKEKKDKKEKKEKKEKKKAKKQSRGE